jgi:hypothetical protein
LIPKDLDGITPIRQMSFCGDDRQQSSENNALSELSMKLKEAAIAAGLFLCNRFPFAI